MSVQTQIKHMKWLGELLGQDLTYIHGPRESGPNGAKKEYLQTGKTFLRALAKDLQFMESKVWDNPAGIGSAGEITLMGMWSEGNGVYIDIHEDFCTGCVLYRAIRHMKDYAGSRNNFLSRDVLLSGDYDRLLRTFSSLNQSNHVQEEHAYDRAS